MLKSGFIRLGIGSLVLEQADSLRTGGTSLTLFKNGWSVLDALGVGSDLRSQFLEIKGYILCFLPHHFLREVTGIRSSPSLCMSSNKLY